MRDIVAEYRNSSLIYKIVSSPNRLTGLLVGITYRPVAEMLTGRNRVFPHADNSLYLKGSLPVVPFGITAATNSALLHGSSIMTAFGVSAAATAAIGQITLTAEPYWVVASLITDAHTGFKAFRSGFRETAGYRDEPKFT